MTCPPRNFLFLQGPQGPFFAELAAGLEGRGHVCHRVNFNGGDRRDWPGPALDFTGCRDAWPHVLEAFLDAAAITDIILFGDCRPLHRAVFVPAASRGVAVHVFEEGYIRPDWVTLERGGVNGHSSLPRDARAYLRLAAGLPSVPAYPPVPASFRNRATETIAYFFAAWRHARRYPGYCPHRPDSITSEAAGWLRRLALRPVARTRASIRRRRFGNAPYFVLPLQLDSDHQIRTHSPFAGMSQALDAVIGSFARHGRPEARLVVKEHPLENGLQPWRRIVASAARRHGIARRVLFLEDGDIEALVRESEGVVTVNSTTGALALRAGQPVVVLGEAIYDLAGITHQRGLDSFWTMADRPQGEIFDAFCRVLVARCLLRGGFSSRAGRALLVPAAVDRLHASHRSVGQMTMETRVERC